MNVKDFQIVKNLVKLKLIMIEDFDKIKFVSNDNLPKGRLIYFLTITVVIRCVLKQEDLFILKFI